MPLFKQIGIILGQGGDLALLTQGYQSFERLDAIIDSQLNAR